MPSFGMGAGGSKARDAESTSGRLANTLPGLHTHSCLLTAHVWPPVCSHACAHIHLPTSSRSLHPPLHPPPAPALFPPPSFRVAVVTVESPRPRPGPGEPPHPRCRPGGPASQTHSCPQRQGRGQNHHRLLGHRSSWKQVGGQGPQGERVPGVALPGQRPRTLGSCDPPRASHHPARCIPNAQDSPP